MENARLVFFTVLPVSIKSYVLNAKLATTWIFLMRIQSHAIFVVMLCLTAKYARLKIFVISVLKITSC